MPWWRHFQGTLFRFPLRTEGIASDITGAAYPSQRVETLLAAFQSQATRALLFLKNVSRIRVQIKREVRPNPGWRRTIVGRRHE